MKKVSFVVKIVDTTIPDSRIDVKRVDWWGNINLSDSTSSNEINFEVSGVDKVGLKHIECKIDRENGMLQF